ncbi:DNA integrity scanning domain-containing protein [Gottschalkia acidurici 9a]|uniref:Diadenylate cyclase n=1 Tax=Gottschalkia acidurici (strain ATCC 7906 / DSM 604 / BCRC 14475 / CIP 104303 / KCTC 5404 / NCIMB 10678 / 9a) TaxID=1128398 RepID=K0B249_GOTA9|nr:diadenylate cyclase CdaA [Gottschalkia acidurici]AFS79192.1 DNA integrity scanning domain-containing protein [Gottschalkia acidurici 9a]
MQIIKELFFNIRIMDVIDIVIVAIVFYKLFMLIRETRAEQLLKGIFLLLVAAKISDILELYTLYWILERAMTVGVIAILIVFQPELRRALEYIGRTKLFSKSIIELEDEHIQSVIEEIVEATASLSRQKIGALMIMEKETGLNEVAETGTNISGKVSSELLINIFIPNTPLHDGAVLIKNDNIKAAACFLPLTENPNLSKELGTRHRAALGITERSDSVAIIVSEETGTISIAEKGKIKRYIEPETLKKVLIDVYKPDVQKVNIFSKWRNKNEQNQG